MLDNIIILAYVYKQEAGITEYNFLWCLTDTSLVPVEGKLISVFEMYDNNIN